MGWQRDSEGGQLTGKTPMKGPRARQPGLSPFSLLMLLQLGTL